MDDHIMPNNTKQTAYDPRIEAFRDECLLFRDFNRPVFLEEMECFIDCASKKELGKLRENIASRAKSLSVVRGNRGRPQGLKDPIWLAKAKLVAWRKHVDEWSWREIAKSEGLKSTKGNTRTPSRRRDRYAGIVWDALTEVLGTLDPSRDRIAQDLQNLKVQGWLRHKAGLPFRRHPQECTKLVQALMPLGRNASRQEFSRLIESLHKKGEKRASA